MRLKHGSSEDFDRVMDISAHQFGCDISCGHKPRYTFFRFRIIYTPPLNSSEMPMTHNNLKSVSDQIHCPFADLDRGVEKNYDLPGAFGKSKHHKRLAEQLKDEKGFSRNNEVQMNLNQFKVDYPANFFQQVK